jgi:hypothetical protein
MTKKLFILVILLLFSAPAFAQVDTAWVRRYNGLGDSVDVAVKIAVDESGSVFVTGWSWNDTSGHDYATIKYQRNGNTDWVRIYNGPANDWDEARALAVDGSGNAFVTGVSGFIGITTIKYYPDGDTAWVRTYNGPDNEGAWANAIAVDGWGNVYVTGSSIGSATSNDYVTIKYYPNGDTAWVRIYNGPGNDMDWANAIAIDASGNVFVTGLSSGSGTYYDYATIEYLANGNTAWAKRYNGPGNANDVALSIAVDGSGNVCVTGASDSSGTYDYATIKYDSNGNIAWVRRYNGPGNADDVALALAIDGSSNIYVTGYSDSSSAGTDYEYATIKYYPNGDTGWVRRRYSGPIDIMYGHPVTPLALDDSGNVYVTGATGGTVGYPDSFDYGTIKYDSSGTMLWMKTYNGTGDGYDEAYSIAVDKSGKVYVTGESYGQGSFEDYATIKYVEPEESIMVLSPNGAETLYVDATYDITWSWTCVESVKIEYSTNAGSSWLPISDVTESDGSYSWLVPNTPSESCLVKITDAEDGKPADTSDGYFTVRCEPAIVVKSPNGGEQWKVNSAYDIKWNYLCFYDSVNIEYTTDNGATWDTIADTTFNDGLYLWTIPDTPSDSCLIRISDVVDKIPSDESDSLFSIVTWIRGDVNGDGVIDLGDVVYLINYLYKGGPAPDPLWVGDVNCDGIVDLGDVVYLINYLYRGGPPPCN